MYKNRPLEYVIMPRKEKHNNPSMGYNLRDIILGGQDGLVNVLGIILAVATAVSDVRIVIIAGLAATFAESVSMAAVAYTSTKAAQDFYKSELEREKRELKEMPEQERREIVHIYRRKGFSGQLLNAIVKKITSNKKLWLETMMEDELHLSKEEFNNPGRDALIVGVSAIVGSLVPLVPFIFLPIGSAIIGSLVLSVVILFVTGLVKGRITTGHTIRSGIEMAAIGMAAAIVGYIIGAALGVALYAA